MKRRLLVGLILIALVGVPAASHSMKSYAQQSEQFKIESSVVLQDSNDGVQEGNSLQLDKRRNTRLVKEGFSALVGETLIRIGLSKTELDYTPGSSRIGLENESSVKIMYTTEGGYALYLGARPGAHTASIFNATGCDRGMNKCFTTSAKPWITSDVYGFGYTIQGRGAAPDFINQSYFRPFSLITTQDPSGALAAEGQARDESISFRTRLNQAQPIQGTFSQNIVITVLHDW